jgi:DoxX-like family
MRRRRKNSFWFPLLGLGFAIAGADKILGVRGYEALFERWGWPQSVMRLIGLGEFAGGVLVASRRHRWHGGMLLTATSGAVLTKELSRGDTDLATPRLALLLASIAALFA